MTFKLPPEWGANLGTLHITKSAPHLVLAWFCPLTTSYIFAVQLYYLGTPSCEHQSMVTQATKYYIFGYSKVCRVFSEPLSYQDGGHIFYLKHSSPIHNLVLYGTCIYISLFLTVRFHFLVAWVLQYCYNY